MIAGLYKFLRPSSGGVASQSESSGAGGVPASGNFTGASPKSLRPWLAEPGSRRRGDETRAAAAAMLVAAALLSLLAPLYWRAVRFRTGETAALRKRFCKGNAAKCTGIAETLERQVA